jgi:flagellar basal body rod protein FlgG
MQYGLYLSAAGLQAQQARQNVLSNNIANAQTAGFKRDLATMQARANAVVEDPRMAPYALPVVKDQGGGVFLAGAGIDLTPASLEKTGNRTDVALDGHGFFTVQGDKPGEKLLTRDGRFLLNRENVLVTANGGRPVLNAEGEPIKLVPSLPITISAKGRISQGDVDGGGGGGGVQLGLVDVPDARRLVKLGANVLTVDRPSALAELPALTSVQQGALEHSGVEPITEMVQMMEGQRAFEANARLITFQDQTLQQLNTIGRVA